MWPMARLPGSCARTLGVKDFFDFAHGAMDVELLAVARDDAGGFLAAMLQGVEAEIGEVRGFGVAKDAEDTTLVVEMIVEKVVLLHQIHLGSCCPFICSRESRSHRSQKKPNNC